MVRVFVLRVIIYCEVPFFIHREKKKKVRNNNCGASFPFMTVHHTLWNNQSINQITRGWGLSLTAQWYGIRKNRRDISSLDLDPFQSLYKNTYVLLDFKGPTCENHMAHHIQCSIYYLFFQMMVVHGSLGFWALSMFRSLCTPCVSMQWLKGEKSCNLSHHAFQCYS